MNKVSNILVCLLVAAVFLLPISGITSENVKLENIEYGEEVSTEVSTELGNTGWYYLQGYDNYCPNGLPDFDQRQQNDWKDSGDHFTFCGPAAVADVLWWFDSKHENPDGTPGDGIDDYPLVGNLNVPGEPHPGPETDDHNYNNVNTLETSWEETNSGELVERLAYYCNTNGCKLPMEISGTMPWSLKRGIEQWIKDVGLENQYSVENVYFPTFQVVDENVRDGKGVILLMGWYYPPGSFGQKLSFVHYVGVAGVHSDGFIAFSDPYHNVEHVVAYTDYNDASVVSHDEWQVEFDSPTPFSKFTIPDYYPTFGFEGYTAIIGCATIITDLS